MFSYVAYGPMLFLTGCLCSRRGPEGVEHYARLLARIYIVCYAGFLLFPLASQGFSSPPTLAPGLSGGWFTSLADAVRSDLHFPGGSLPSAHCAAATGMLAALWRYNRGFFWICLPIIAPIYIATIYGQFHYLWDSVSGILVGLAVIRFTPASPSVHPSFRR